VAGAPIGAELVQGDARRQEDEDEPKSKSIIIVVATDAPLLPHQLKRLARRASLGLARTGSISGNGSGDIFLAFSTANAGAASADGTTEVAMISNSRISALFEATVQATEEAIINALIAAETMTGRGGTTAQAIPHDRVRDILTKYGRLQPR
jgi:D-aminopeptidase